MSAVTFPASAHHNATSKIASTPHRKNAARAAHAQLVGGSPFETGFSAMKTLFTGTVAKVASLIAIVLGGYQFAHGEPGTKKALAGVAAGTGIAVLATNVLTWLWGV